MISHPQIELPKEVKIKASYEGIYALHKAITRYRGNNPVTPGPEAIFFVDLLLDDLLKKINFLLKKKILAFEEKHNSNFNLKFSLLEILYVSEAIKYQVGDSISLRNILEAFYKKAIQWHHLIVFRDALSYKKLNQFSEDNDLLQ